VKRYDLEARPGWDQGDEMVERPEGDWIRYDDPADTIRTLRLANERMREILAWIEE